MSETLQTALIKDKIFEKNIIARSVFNISTQASEKIFFWLIREFQEQNQALIKKIKNGEIHIEDLKIEDIKNEEIKINYCDLFSYNTSIGINERTKHIILSKAIGDFIILDGKYITLFEYIDTKKYKNAVAVKLRQLLLKEYLDVVKDFTVYHITEILELQGIYAIRLYHILKSYEYLDYIILDIDNLKRILNCYIYDENGKIIKDKYTNFGQFRLRVLETAKKQIERKTTLRFNYNAFEKEGRKITKIKFTFTKKLKYL